MTRTIRIALALAALVAAGAVGGCHSEEGAVPTAAPLNPGGKPRNEKEATEQAAQQEAGQHLNSAMSTAADAERAAKARTGGK